VTGGVADEPKVVHVDEALIVYDKPPGWLVIPGRGIGAVSLREFAEARFGRVWVVHRLDRGTSGLVVFARDADSHRFLNGAFERHAVQKKYLALVSGSPPSDLRIDVPLVAARRGRMRPAHAGDRGAKPSATRVHLVERFRSAALIEVEPETGRTHQIRVHLRSAGFPLLFDPDYGADEPTRNASGLVVLSRTPLHASRMRLPHPNGAQLALGAPLPPDMELAIEAFRSAST
jgi:tRNA pseudouridine32 synthase / 23S rRNA pseudouridine746 synthase